MTVSRCVRAEILPGYVFGLVQPSLFAIVDLSGAIDPAALGPRLRRAIAPHVPPERPDMRRLAASSDAWGALGTEISVAVAGLQEAAGIPVAGAAWVRTAAAQTSGPRRQAVHLVMPSHAPRAAAPALTWVLEALDALAAAPLQEALSTKQVQVLVATIASFVPFAPRGTNNIRFIRAAHAAGIPVTALPGEVYQFGWGHRGRWFKSTITDETAAIAAMLSKNKALTNATLRMAGIPVPDGRRARDEADAVAIAEDLGFPVVVKPADRDQGQGVAVDVRTVEAVRDAYRGARKLSREVLVERHVAGIALRITVFRGRAAATVKRLPAGVTGDGGSTIEALVVQVNKDPRRSTSRFSIMKPIVVDDEAREILAALGMCQTSIPAAGQFVPLKRAANVSTGGDTIVLDGSDVHPSYAELAERATQVLRLDVSGVDIVTGDPHTPWFEAGAAVIEVNAQPQMGTILTHLHGLLLRQYVRGDGTIPTVIVLGSDKQEFARRVRERCLDGRARVGVVSADGVFAGADQVWSAHAGASADARSLLIDPTVTALLVAIEEQEIRRRGLPIPFFDHLVLAGAPDGPAALSAALAQVQPHLRGALHMTPDDAALNIAGRVFGPGRVRQFPSTAALVAAVVPLLTRHEPRSEQ